MSARAKEKLEQTCYGQSRLAMESHCSIYYQQGDCSVGIALFYSSSERHQWRSRFVQVAIFGFDDFTDKNGELRA